MSWRRRKDEEMKRWKEMFPWMPFDLFENSEFFNEDFMDNLMREMERLMKNFDVNDPEAFKKKFGPFVYGWNMSIGPDGKPQFKEFGNLKPSTKGVPIASKDREPLVDVFIEDKIVRILIELPGVSKDDISVKTTDSKVMISAKAGERTYSTERDLSVKVKPNTAVAKYKNGVLELTIERKEPVTEEGYKVKIE